MEIHIKIVDRTGHSEAVCQSAFEAKSLIAEHEANGKWCYLDGNYAKSDTISEQDIERASNILLAGSLVGGA